MAKKSSIRKFYNIIIFIYYIHQYCKKFCLINQSKFGLNNKNIKDLIIIYNNDIYLNSIYKMIEYVLQFYYQINTFYIIN